MPASAPVQGARLLSSPDVAGNAGFEDMEYHSKLPVLRHYVENRLASFAIAVSTYDASALGRLLATVHVGLLNEDARLQTVDAQGILAWFTLRNRPSLLTTSSLSIYYSGPAVRYTAIYQLWATDADLNQAPSFGVFHGSFEPGPQVWKWTEHVIQPAGC